MSLDRIDAAAAGSWWREEFASAHHASLDESGDGDTSAGGALV
jgi:hypothetical protein